VSSGAWEEMKCPPSTSRRDWFGLWFGLVLWWKTCLISVSGCGGERCIGVCLYADSMGLPFSLVCDWREEKPLLVVHKCPRRHPLCQLPRCNLSHATQRHKCSHHLTVEAQ
jgi:hypothetical protein